MDFPVNTSLFLRLTDQKLGPYSLYIIKTNGVESEYTLEILDEIASQQGSGNEVPILLDQIETARLTLPTSAKQLVGWQKENTDFELPEWFDRIVETDDVSNAIAILDEISNHSEEAASKLGDEINALKGNGAKPMVWYPLKQEADRIFEVLAAINQIRTNLTQVQCGQQPCNTSSSKDIDAKELGRLGGKKSNAANREIREAIISAYKAGNYKSKNAAAPDLAKKFHRSEGVVRRMLKGVHEQ